MSDTLISLTESMMQGISRMESSVTERLMTAQEVATFLGVPMATLYQWRVRGAAPRAVKVGRHLRFRRDDVDAWVESHSDDRSVA